MKILAYLTVSVITVTAVFGMIKRQSYTDIVKEEDYLQQLEVAELSENMAISGCDVLLETLPDSPIILRVTATEEFEPLFWAGRQKVYIQEIFAGSGLEAGKEIYLTFPSWSLIVDENRNSVQRGFVNVMKTDCDYLVFISKKIDTLYETIPVYSLVADTYIAPIFCYENSINVVAPTSGNTTYVPYMQVKDNEFFAESVAALQAWERLKEKLLSAFPANG